MPHHLACKLQAQLGHTRGAAKLPAVAWPEHATMRKIVQSIGKEREEQQQGNGRGSGTRSKSRNRLESGRERE